jgi:hypothetical protein
MPPENWRLTSQTVTEGTRLERRACQLPQTASPKIWKEGMEGWKQVEIYLVLMRLVNLAHL